MKKYEFNSYIGDDNEQYACASHAHMFTQLEIFKYEILVSGMSTVNSLGRHQWLYHSIYVWLMTVLSSSYGIITDHTINAPGHVKNVVDGLNLTDKRYLKGEI